MDYRGPVHYDDYGRESRDGSSANGSRNRGHRDRDRDRGRNDRDRDRDRDRGRGEDRRRDRDDHGSREGRDRHSNGNGHRNGHHSHSRGRDEHCDRVAREGSRRERERSDDFSRPVSRNHHEEGSRDRNGNGNGNGIIAHGVGREGGYRSRGERNSRRPRSGDRNGDGFGEPDRRRPRIDNFQPQRPTTPTTPPVNNGEENDEPMPGPSNGGAPPNGFGGRGRGSGRRQPEGRRGTRRPRFVEDTRSIEERFDFVPSRPTEVAEGENRANIGKKGKLGPKDKQVSLMANYFHLTKLPAWRIFNYHVAFSRPNMVAGSGGVDGDEEDCMTTNVKKDLVRHHAVQLGSYIFDGANLFTREELPMPLELLSPMRTWNRRRPGADNATGENGQNFTEENIRLDVTLVADLQPGDPQCLQFYNIIIRNCLEHLKLELVSRNYFDPYQSKQVPGCRLELWPGYVTSIRNHEQSLMLNVEITHRVLRYDTALTVYQKALGDNNKAKRNLVGQVVMTVYNRKTYKITDIDFEQTPLSTFRVRNREKPGGFDEISYVDYYERLPQPVRIKTMNQPLLATRPKKKDYHRGKMRTVYLIPELCQMTGIDEDIRKNFTTMREISKVCQQRPRDKLDTVQRFMDRLRKEPRVQEEFSRWDLAFDTAPVSLEGRVLPFVDIVMGHGKTVQAEPECTDWTRPMQSCEMFSNKGLAKNWVIVVPQQLARNVDNLLRTMQRVGGPMNFKIQEPLMIDRIRDSRVESYAKAIDGAVAKYRNHLEMMFFILPGRNKTAKQTTEIWQAVKELTFVNYGISSQCFLEGNLNSPKGLMSIATKVVIQMNAKLGGIPWSITNGNATSSKMMVIGFDIHHSGKGQRKESVGAMVATMSNDFTKHFSTTAPIYQTGLCDQMRVDVLKCADNYLKVDGSLPDRIILYRDGVGEGQLKYINDVELQSIKDGLLEMYGSFNEPPPKFTFIVVTKRINTRFFLKNKPNDNVRCGTIVDDVVTLPERFDFYLVSQHAKQGTVSPTAYNVLFDEQGQPPDRLQRFTYKMTHLYYNWNGPVSVPAVCQYAKKLAYLSGIALNSKSAQDRLSNYLYYL